MRYIISNLVMTGAVSYMQLMDSMPIFLKAWKLRNTVIGILNNKRTYKSKEYCSCKGLFLSQIKNIKNAVIIPGLKMSKKIVMQLTTQCY